MIYYTLLYGCCISTITMENKQQKKKKPIKLNFSCEIQTENHFFFSNGNNVVIKTKCPKNALYTRYKFFHRFESIAKSALNFVFFFGFWLYFLLCTLVVISSKAASWMFNIKLLADKNTLFCELAICKSEELVLIKIFELMARYSDTYGACNTLGCSDFTQFQVSRISANS